MGNSFTGKTPDDLQKTAMGECGYRLIRVDKSLSPPQSYGNRLRHWLRSENPNMKEVRFEFIEPLGICHLSVRLRQNEIGQWRIFYFAGHAY